MSKTLQETIEEQNLLLKEQAEERERERREEEHRRLQEEYRRRLQEHRERMLQQYHVALPKCKYCGEPIDHSSPGNSAIFEYCCKKCAVSDLGKNHFDDYQDVGCYHLSQQLDELINEINVNDPETALTFLKIRLLANGMDSFSRSQIEALMLAYSMHWEYETDLICYDEKNMEKILRFLLGCTGARKAKAIGTFLRHSCSCEALQYSLLNIFFETLKNDDNTIDELLTRDQQLDIVKGIGRDTGSSLGHPTPLWQDERFAKIARMLWLNVFFRHSDDKQKVALTMDTMNGEYGLDFGWLLVFTGANYIYRENIQDDDFKAGFWGFLQNNPGCVDYGIEFFRGRPFANKLRLCAKSSRAHKVFSNLAKAATVEVTMAVVVLPFCLGRGGQKGSIVVAAIICIVLLLILLAIPFVLLNWKINEHKAKAFFKSH